MTARRTYAGPQPSLTRGEDRPPGACLSDPYWFDQAAGDAGVREMDYAIRQAKAICATCPLTGVGGPCMKENADVPGVIAGMTGQERGALKRAKPCGSEASYRRHRKAGENCPTCSAAATRAAAARKARKAAA